MTGQRCHVCGNTHAKDSTVSFHRIPKDARRAKWLEALGLCEDDIKQSTRICSRHFPNGDSKKTPSLSLGELTYKSISIDYTAAGFALYCINDACSYLYGM